MNYTRRCLMAITLLGGFIFASPVKERQSEPVSSPACKLILVQSACASVTNPGAYTFTLNSCTEAFYNQLYFNFCHPVSGAVISSVANSQNGPRSVQGPGLGNWKVIISVNPISQVNYAGTCSYSSYVTVGGLGNSASPLICSFSNCDLDY